MRIVFLLLSLASVWANAAQSVDATWVGPGEGFWSDANNWSGGVVPNGRGHIARIDSSSPVVIKLENQGVVLGELCVSGSSHVLAGSKHIYFQATEGQKDVFVNVADGSLLTVSNMVESVTARESTFVKTGKGALVLKKSGLGSNNAFDGVEVREGLLTIAWQTSTDGLHPNKKIKICSGARLDMATHNPIQNDVIVHIEKGGVFDIASCYDVIGGITGDGEVTGDGKLTLTLGGGPHRFNGTFTCVLKLIPATSGLGVDTGENTRFVVGSRKTAAFGEIDFSSAETAGRPCPLTFAGDAGGVFELKECVWAAHTPLEIQDVSGNPVTVHFLSDINKRPLRGTGSAVLAYEGNSYAVTNDLLSIEGSLHVMSNQTVNLGMLASHLDPDISRLGSISLDKGTTLICRTCEDLDMSSTPVEGEGRIYMYSSYNWILPASVTGTLWWGTNVGEGGTITLCGGSTKAPLNMNDVTSANLSITGGDHDFTGVTYADRQHKFYQSGGTARFHPITGYKTNQGYQEVYYYISGGEMHSTTSGDYSRGFGAVIDNDARVYLSSPDSRTHRISSDGHSHSITLKDRALLEADRLLFATGGKTTDFTSRLDLLGGTFRIHEYMSILNGSKDDYPYFQGTITFDGGRVEALSLNSQDWNLSPTYTDGSATTGYVGRAGLTWYSNHRLMDTYTYLKMPLAGGCEKGETDGGLLKLGRGALITYGESTYTGPTRVYGGILRNTGTADPKTPFGTGTVDVDSAVLGIGQSAAQTLASDAGAVFSYGGGASLMFWNTQTGGDVTIGPAGAACGEALVRKERGVLTLGAYECGNTLQLGGTHKIRVAGGMPLDEQTKIVKAPVFSALPEGKKEWVFLRHLTYDAQNGFILAACTEGLGGGATSVARITTTPVSLASDAHVGALDLSYITADGKYGAGGLTIADNATLRIGNGAGTLGTILFNNQLVTSDAPSQTLKGGTVDFGAAEGILVFNMGRYYGWWRPSQITSKLAGQGGVTFAGLGDTHNYRCEVELHTANTYTGGTWIENVGVKAMANGVFSSDTVTVVGGDASGGTIWVPNNSKMTQLDNALVLSGVGRYSQPMDKLHEPDYGALRIDRNLTVNGKVSLSRDTRIQSVGANVAVSFTGGFCDIPDTTNTLTVAGSGTTLFKAPATYKGRTVVEGILEIGPGGTLGAGPVEVCANGTLRFSNTDPIVVTNDLSGAGHIVIAGAPVSFTGKTAFTGTRVECVAASDGDFVKEGAYTQRLETSQTYTGDTHLKEGTLALGRVAPIQAPYADRLVMRLDATRTDTFVFDETSPTNISKWHDADGRNLYFSQSAPAYQGLLNKGAINGRDGVWLHGDKTRLVGSKALTCRSVCAVTMMSSDVKNYNWSCAGVIGCSGLDNGIRTTSGKQWADDGWSKFGEIRVNGVSSRDWLFDTPSVSSFRTGMDLVSVDVAVGDYWNNPSWKRCMRGSIGEILVYDYSMGPEEIAAVESYLSEKWGIPCASEYAKSGVDLLPVTTDVIIDEGAVLDFCGATQTVSTVSGTGLVTNSAPVRACLKITGSCTATWSLGGDFALYVAKGAVLDLGGRTLRVAEVGGEGTILNGTLVVEDAICPGDVESVGSLTCKAKLEASGATLAVEGDGTGDCDKLVLEQAFSCASMRLAVRDFSRLTSPVSRILESAGGVTGPFAADNIPNRRIWTVRFTSTAVDLVRENGLLFILK